MNDHSSSESSLNDEVKQYQRAKITMRFLGMGLSFAALVIMALVVGPRLPSMLPAYIAECRWLLLLASSILFAGVIELITLPLDFYSGYVLEHRYQLSTQTIGRWIGKRLLRYLVSGIIALPLVFGLYGFLWYTGGLWWFWCALAFLGVTLLLGRIAPILILPLFYKITPLDDDSLKSRLRELAEGTGLTIEGVYQLHLSAETKKANAALAGLGKSRRVLLGDTLLQQFTPDEIAVVFAHEVGHHVYGHLAKSVALSVITTMAGFWLADLALTQLASRLGYLPLEELPAFKNPAALPLFFLVLSVFGLLLSPLQNAISRFHERQCDSYALKKTSDKQAYRSAFRKLATINKSDPNPSAWLVWLFYDHPPIHERIAMADQI